ADRTRPQTSAASAPVAPKIPILEQLAGASPSHRHERLLDFVGEHVARVLGAPDAAAIDPRQPLHEIGLDPWMAVALRNRLGVGLGLGRSLPATLVFDHPPLEALATYLMRDVVNGGEAEPSDSGGQLAVQATAVGAIDEMSDDEIEQLF